MKCVKDNKKRERGVRRPVGLRMRWDGNEGEDEGGRMEVREGGVTTGEKGKGSGTRLLMAKILGAVLII